MKTTVKTKSGNVYEFINESWITNRSWGHKTKLYLNGQYIDDNKVTYFNRTWESYQYQSCMKGLIYKRIKIMLKDYINTYKLNLGIKRLPNGKKAELEVEFKQQSELYEVLKAL